MRQTTSRLRAALSRLGFSQGLVRQKKRDVTLPLARWQRGELAADTRALAGRAEVGEGLLDGDVLARILKDHLAGRRNLYRIIHALQVFRAWRARYPVLAA